MGENIKTPAQIMAAKLMAIQKELKAPKDKTNDFGKYKYRSCESILEAVKPFLAREGVALILSDEIVEVGGRVYVKATAQISDGVFPIEATAYAREAAEKKGMDDSQVTGTASSYARKYALNGLFAIDDTKDADTNEYAKETQGNAKKGTSKKAAAENANSDDVVMCAECGKEIVDHLPNASKQMIIDASRNIYKKALCFDCIAKHEREKQAKKQAELAAVEMESAHGDAGDRV